MLSARRRRSAVTLCLPLIGCLYGDFGRVRPSIVYDDMHAWVGEEAAKGEGIPASEFPLSEEERQLRDLAYPLIAPPYERLRWFRLLDEYGLTGAVVPEAPFTLSAYADALLSEPRRAANSLYSQLIDDIRDDITRLGPFFSTARYVSDMDAKRRRSLAYVAVLTPAERDNAMRRIAENALVTDWVSRSLGRHAAAYRFALERLVIMVPSPMAVEAERQLTLLKMKLAQYAPPPAPVAVKAPAPRVTKD